MRLEAGGWRLEVGVRWLMHFSNLRSLACSVLAAALVLVSAAPARADLTGFLGVTTTPASRTNGGFAAGTGFLIVAFEFEYAATKEDVTNAMVAPALKTYMFNGLLQTPIPIARTQFYGTIGGGVYHETLSSQPLKASPTNASLMGTSFRTSSTSTRERRHRNSKFGARMLRGS